jgi:hypothetical protein
MTLSTVVITNDVEKYTHCTQNSLKIEAAYSSKMLVTTYNRLQGTIILDINQILHNCEEHKHIYIYTMPLWCRELL